MKLTLLALLTITSLAASTPAAAADAAACPARPVGTVVELYTSEGCSSCPPADRWASTLKGREGVLTLAFHVDYWDRLGWPDRFASKEATRRQYQLAQASGRNGVYTPQVVVNGEDWRRWPALPAPALAVNPALPAPALAVNPALPGTARLAAPQLQLQLERRGEQVVARLAAGAPRTLAGYWAVLEDNHTTPVRAGENAGATLRHDHVVRLYQPVPAFSGERAQQWELAVSGGASEFPRRVAFVVSDAQTFKPLQALVLPLGSGC